jgi:Flp pilus assembly protein TadD
MPGRRISAGRLRRWLKSEPPAEPATLFRLGAGAHGDLAWRAHRLFEKRRFVEAERIYELMVWLWPLCRAEAMLGRGACKQQQGDLDGALGQYNAVLALEPENRFALANRAEIYLLTQRSGEAWADLEAAMRSSATPNEVDALAARIEQLRAIAERESSALPASAPS